MSEKSCSHCVKFFECNKRIGTWNNKKGVYEHCDEIETDERLEGRSAMCADCGSYEPSRPSLPFFWYRPDKEYDSYYCGCRGWD